MTGPSSASTDPTCSKCGGPRDRPGQRYCSGCHAEYQRDWRKRQPKKRLPPEERMREYARQMARAALAQGLLVAQPCEVCGATERIQMHHDDYMKPLDVRWFCDRHHKRLHAAA